MCASYMVVEAKVKCKGTNLGTTLEVSGFKNLATFEKITCKRNGVLALIFKDCSVEQIKLPIANLKKRYPFVRSIEWDCEGLCVYSKLLYSKLRIKGNCREGKYLAYFNISSTYFNFNIP